MRIIKNSLSDSLVKECLSEINSNNHTSVWKSSLLSWNDDLKIGITGSCLIAEPHPSLNAKLEKEVSHYFPNYEKIKFLYYVWQPNSGISPHNDSGFLFGATIYLNEWWDINWGGLYLWRKKDEEYWTALVPSYKTLILNPELEDHLVTPISPFSPTLRYTIQIWAK